MNGGDRKWMGRIEAKIDNMHDDIKENKRWSKSLQKNLNKVYTQTILNTNWREDHSQEHKGYFGKAIAIIGILAAVFTIGWNIFIAILTGKW